MRISYWPVSFYVMEKLLRKTCIHLIRRVFRPSPSSPYFSTFMIAVGEKAWGILLKLAGRFSPHSKGEKTVFLKNQIRQQKDGWNIFRGGEEEKCNASSFIAGVLLLRNNLCRECCSLQSRGKYQRFVNSRLEKSVDCNYERSRKQKCLRVLIAFAFFKEQCRK